MWQRCVCCVLSDWPGLDGGQREVKAMGNDSCSLVPLSAAATGPRHHVKKAGGGG